MKVSKKVFICWFKDIRWDKSVYDANIIYRFGKLGIIIKI